MPRLPDKIIDSVFYLYKDRASAEKGENAGGTGFMVGLRSQVSPGGHYQFAITNWHVACRDGFSTIRLNTKDGSCDIIELDPSDWRFGEIGHDAAITNLPIAAHHSAAFILDDLFADEKVFAERQYGLGEDVFMIGRFVDVDTPTKNNPSARFGNISMMPIPIPNKRGKSPESFCLDMHSRSGFSGSPVFVFRTMGSDLRTVVEGGDINLVPPSMYLLGIHWGQFTEDWELNEELSGPEKEIALSGKNKKIIKGLSGMTVVAPVSAIRELIDLYKDDIEQNERMIRVTKGNIAPEEESQDGKASITGDEILETMLNTPPETHQEFKEKH